MLPPEFWIVCVLIFVYRWFVPEQLLLLPLIIYIFLKMKENKLKSPALAVYTDGSF